MVSRRQARAKMRCLPASVQEAAPFRAACAPMLLADVAAADALRVYAQQAHRTRFIAAERDIR